MRTACNPQRKTLGRDLFVALLCGAFVALIGGLSYAAVPLYSWFFNRASGFGGTTEVAAALPGQQSPRLVAVRFDSDSAAGPPWSFRPPRNSVDARLGQVVAVSLRVTNEAGRVGQPGHSVRLPRMGLHFEKINCFCFAPQINQRGESRDMAVMLYLADDSDQDGVSTITFFYTFYLARASVPPAAERARPPASGPAGRI